MGVNTGRSGRERVGVWFIGALGDIATTTITGALAIRQSLTGTAGLTTELPPMNQMDLVALDDLVFGGLDIRAGSAEQSARDIANGSRTFPPRLVEAIGDTLAEISANIVIEPAMRWNRRARLTDQPPLAELLARHCDHIRAFVGRNRLQRVVVVDVSSSEPVFELDDAHLRLDGFRRLIADNRKDRVAPSMLSAYAALLENCSYINFTPNAGIAIGALGELADQQHVAYAGSDGKTGETLVKTALAPMFACRNLRVMSWEATNMLGNSDGATLNNPENRVAKLRNKAGVLEQMLGYKPHENVSINYVPSLGDWKTAWDLVHFQGFLDVPMSMQFTWQGCDSILAAPLVLDMVRLGEFAARHGESGPMRHLACFFKNPMGVDEMALSVQFQRLLDYAAAHVERRQRQERRLGPLA